MKSKDFLLVLRHIIREENRKVIKEEIKLLKEELTLLIEGKQQSPSSKKQNIDTILSSINTTVPTKSPSRKYTDNKMINELLQSTSVDSGFKSAMPITMTGEPIPAEAVSDDLTAQFANRDYSKVLKLSLEKSGKA